MSFFYSLKSSKNHDWYMLCMAESLQCSPETTTTLLIGYTPTQNKKLKKKRITIGDSTGHSNYWF